MKNILSIIFLLCASLHSAEIETPEAAMKLLESEDFEEREAATAFLQTHHLPDEQLKALKAIASGAGEAATRAAGTLDWQIYGLKTSASKEATATLQTYKNLKDKTDPNERLRVLKNLVHLADNDLDVQKLCFMEAAACERKDGSLAEFMSYFSEFYNQDQNPATPAQQEKFWQLARQLSERSLLELVKTHGDFRLCSKVIIESEKPPTRGLYQFWGEQLMSIQFEEKNPNGDLAAEEKKIMAVFSRLLKESPDFLPDLAKSANDKGLFAAAERLRSLGIPTSEQPLLLRQYAVPQHNTDGGMPVRLARVILFWNDLGLVPEILESALDPENADTLRALTSHIFFSNKIHQWIAKYQKRLKKNNSALNRRLLAHLLRAQEKRDEAFAILTPEDKSYPLYYTLALETGHWLEANEIFTEIFSKRSTNQLGYHLGAAFFLQHAGLIQEADEHIAKILENTPKGEDNKRQPFSEKILQGLLVLRHPDLAFNYAKDHNHMNDAFEILTLQHKYPEAQRLALDCARDPNQQATAKFALDYFKTRAPEKAAEIQAILAAFTPASAPPASSPKDAQDQKTPERLFAAMENGEDFDWNYLYHVRTLAAKPENNDLRLRLLQIWRKTGENHLDLEEMTPVLEQEQEWQTLADGWFLIWQSFRNKEEALYNAGRFLKNAGQVAEGERRMELSKFMAITSSPWSLAYLLKVNDPNNPQGFYLSHSSILLSHMNKNLWPDDGYATRLRDFHRYYRDQKRYRTAGFIWATAHLYGIMGGYSYSNSFYALNNGMHLQEDLGIDAVNNGHIAEAETRLAEAWRISIEPTALAAALIKRYQNAGQEKEALRIYETFRDRLQSYTKEMPGDPRFPEKLSEWQKVTGM